MPQNRALGSLEKDFRTSWFDELPLSVVILDLDGKFAYVNEAFEYALGLSRNAIIGTSPDQYVRPADQVRLMHDVLELFRGVQSKGMTYDFVRPGGTTRKISFVSTPIYGAKRKSGRAVKYVLIVQIDSRV